MRNNKRTIRLTESDLHRVIKESVKQCLTELDWKTYANAANKSSKRSGISYWRDKGYDLPDAFKKAVRHRQRVKQFGDAAKDAFGDQYGYSNGMPYDNDYASVKLGGDFDATEEFAPHVVGYKSKGYGNPRKLDRRWDTSLHKRSEPEEFFGDNADASKSFRNAEDEYDAYKGGKYRYDSLKNGGDGKWKRIK